MKQQDKIIIAVAVTILAIALFLFVIWPKEGEGIVVGKGMDHQTLEKVRNMPLTVPPNNK